MSAPDAAAPVWQGLYSDGRRGPARPVVVALAATHLVIAESDGAPLARWPLDAVRLLDRPTAGGALRLAHFGQPERLTIAAPEALEALSRRCAALRKGAYRGPGWRAVALWGGIAVASVAFVLFVLLPLIAHQAAMLISPRLERQLGDRLSEMLVALAARPAHPVCAAAASRQALARLAGPIFAGARLDTAPELTVVDSPLVNALALPGNRILEQPNELAGVLAHEVAHLEFRHPTEIVIERGAGAAIVGAILGDVFGGSAIAMLGRAMVSARYSRDAERAADARGIELLESAGLDPRPFGAFFARLAQKEDGGGSIAPFLAGHPATERRARLVDALPAGGREALDSADWQRLKAICD